jgi:hypothetical protein
VFPVRYEVDSYCSEKIWPLEGYKALSAKIRKLDMWEETVVAVMWTRNGAFIWWD